MITLTLNFVNPCSQKIYTGFFQILLKEADILASRLRIPLGCIRLQWENVSHRFHFWLGVGLSICPLYTRVPSHAKKPLRPPGTAAYLYFFSKKASHNSVSEVVMPSAPAFNAFSTSSRVRINPPAKIGMPSRSFTSVIIHGAIPGKTSI